MPRFAGAGLPPNKLGSIGTLPVAHAQLDEPHHAGEALRSGTRLEHLPDGRNTALPHHGVDVSGELLPINLRLSDTREQSLHVDGPGLGRDEVLLDPIICRVIQLPRGDRLRLPGRELQLHTDSRTAGDALFAHFHGERLRLVDGGNERLLRLGLPRLHEPAQGA